MIFFEEAALRLKQQLKYTQDKEVAAWLGLSPRAWAGRKKNESFPEKELYALVAKHPELNIDVQYVLTGQRATARQAQLTQSMIEASANNGTEPNAIALNVLATNALKNMAQINSSREESYQYLIELLNDCSDESVKQVIALTEKIRLADI